MKDPVFEPVPYFYTRAKAIEDGALVDVSGIAREMGFRYSVALTSGVWEIVEPQEGGYVVNRLLEVLRRLKFATWSRAGKSAREDAIHFPVAFDGKINILWARFGSGDLGEPVVTVMLHGEK